MWRPWKQVSAPVALNFERSNIGRSLFLPRLGSEHREQLVEAFGRHEAEHLAVVEQHHRRIGAGAEAFALLHGDETVARRAAFFDAEPLADMRQRRFAVAQLA